LNKPIRRSVVLRVSALCAEVLGGKKAKGSKQDPTTLERALRFYLGNRGSGQPGWVYPTFLRDEIGTREVDLELEVDNGLWRAFRKEAARQDVSDSKLAAHAVLYYAAELDAGRIAQRIVDAVKEDETEPEKAESEKA
jgi:hypothetical protein